MKLTDTQRKLLQSAANHPEKLLTDFPDNLKGGARLKVLYSLEKSGCIQARGKTNAGSPQFEISQPGFEALGLHVPKSASDLTAHASIGSEAPGEGEATIRAGTKQATLIELLRRPQGATLGQMVEATGWQSHTVRGSMAGSLKKKLGLNIISVKSDGIERTYRIA